MKVSLIISVYKNVTDLKVVLDSLKWQTYKSFEIVVSEDGDSEVMRNFVTGYKAAHPLIHLTQKDEGWRKNKALNNAVRRASGDYLIFIDGDCVLHHRFIENHVRFSGKGRILGGKRVKLGPHYTDLFRSGQPLPELEKKVVREGRAVRRDGAKFFEEGFYFAPGSLLGFIPRLRKMSELKGCNMSFSREAIETINGFDEDYQLPAIGEDIDLTWRFRGMGYTLFSLRNLAVQYHLHHKENWTDQSENQRMMEEKIRQKLFICKNGLRK